MLNKFKNPRPFLLSAIISAVISIAVFIFLLSSGTELLNLLTLIILIFIISLLTSRIFIELFIIRRIRKVCRSIEEMQTTKKDKKYSHKFESYELDRLEKEVNRLIYEKTHEIDQLKELEKYRRGFLENVAHELRTPIFSIQGYLHTLMDGAIHDDKVNLRFLNKAAKNVDNLTALIEDLIIISTLESGKHKIEKSKFNICHEIQEVIESLEWAAKQKDINISFQNNELNNIEVFADQKKIRQVLVNLIDNSIKYGKKNGQTIVKIYDMGIDVNISISDNGEGIEKMHLARIFERFYRIDKSRSRVQGGTGLGLAIVKHFIEAHKQSINVESSPGVGTTFRFSLEKALY